MRKRKSSPKTAKVPKVPKAPKLPVLIKQTGVNSLPLKFKNPFRTSARKQQLYSVYKSPIHRTGITSLEREQQMRAMEKINQLKNAGIYDPDDEAWFNVTFKDFGDTAMFPLDKDLPQGVTSVETAEKMRNAMQQAQAYNAGIVSAKQARLKSLLKVLRKRQMKQLENKAIQYLAETDELDQIPEEYQEAVSNWYYNDLPAKYRKYVDASLGQWITDDEAQRNLSSEEQDEFERIKREFKDEYSKMQDRLSVKRNVEKKRATRRKFDKDFAEEDTGKHARNVYRQMKSQELEGHGTNVIGWRAPYLYTLLRPLHSLDKILEQTPEERIKEAKEEIDEMRDEYREMQKEQRGVAPPKEMINRAFPKTAAPLIDYERKNPDHENPGGHMIAHPFIFPRRKFFVKSFY